MAVIAMSYFVPHSHRFRRYTGTSKFIFYGDSTLQDKELCGCHDRIDPNKGKISKWNIHSRACVRDLHTAETQYYRQQLKKYWCARRTTRHSCAPSFDMLSVHSEPPLQVVWAVEVVMSHESRLKRLKIGIVR